MVLVYRSPRRMGDLAVGLIEGCALHFGEVVAIDRVVDGDSGRVHPDPDGLLNERPVDQPSPTTTCRTGSPG